MKEFSRHRILKVTSLLIFIFALIVAGLNVFVASANEQVGNELFTDSDSPGSLDSADNPTIDRVRFVDVNFGMLEAAEVGDALLFNLFADVSFTAVLDRLEATKPSGYSWIGHLEGVNHSQVVLVVAGGQIAGNITLPGAFYQIRFAGDGVHAIYKIDQSAFPPEAEPLSVELSEEALAQAESKTMADDGSFIDVMVVYTAEARADAGGTTAMLNLINLAVTETNQSYINSVITQRINLVHTAEVSYTETGDIGLDLSRLRNPSDGYMDNVHTLRDTHMADLVDLLVENGGPYCGVAYFMTTVSPAFESYGFSVVDADCATGYYSFGHELGHNMGAGHDWYVYDDVLPYTYSHAYVNVPDQWRTVMAYNSECAAHGVNCTRLQYWSNPDINYGGDPMGVPAGTSTACVAGDLGHPACDADHRLTLNNTALTVANFRDSSGGNVGPLEYDSHLVDDDNSGNSSGDDDGIVDCGETIELYVDLINQGVDTATSVVGTISTSDPYITFIYNTSSGYPDILGGGTGTNTDDFDFVVDPSTPHGHIINFDLDISASNGGPWSDSFDVPVTCGVPDIDVDPTSFYFEVVQGDAEMQPMMINNVGSADLTFDIIDEATGAPVSPEQFDEPEFVVDPSMQSLSTTEGLDLTAPAVAEIFDVGDVIQSWPSGLPKAWGVGFDGLDNTVWTSSPGPFWGGNNSIHEYQTNGSPTGRSHPYPWVIENGPADVAFNWNTGMLWVMDVAHDNCIHEIDPASGVTGATICPGFPVSQRGLAYDPLTDTYLAGSWNDSMIYRFTPAGTILEQVNVGLAIAGLAYNPDTQHLFVMVNASPNPVYVLDAADSYNILGQFSISQDFGAYSGAGLEIDCEGQLWAVDQSLDTVYEIDSGETTSVCFEDAAWLHEDPITGSVPPGGSQPVDVVVDTTGLGLGTYTANIIIFNNDPDENPTIVPVTLEVVPEAPDIEVDPTSVSSTQPQNTVRVELLDILNVGGANLLWGIFEEEPPTAPQAGSGEWLYRSEDGVMMSVNSGGEALAYPSAYRWEPADPSALTNILIYADDPFHPAPNTFIDQALKILGLSYFAHYDGDFAGFEASLAGGPWDLVLFGTDYYAPPSTTWTALDNYVNAGGRLIYSDWFIEADPFHPLFTTLGFTWVASDYGPPDPVYWWVPGHPIFTNPENVPEFTVLVDGRYSIYGQYVEPLPGFDALAGYTTPGPDPNQAAMVMGNSGRTVFKGFMDGHNDADLDTDGRMDGIELWINMIVGVGEGLCTPGDIPWVSVNPLSGTTPPGGFDTLDVTFDSTGLGIGTYNGNLCVLSNDPDEPLVIVPLELEVEERGPVPPADFDGDGDTDISVYHWHATYGQQWYIKDQGTWSWGAETSIPVPADYDGDGDTDIAVYDNGLWYIKDIGVYGWGGPNSVPVPGDYDGDGDADIAVIDFHPIYGLLWYIKDQPTHSWGNAASLPVQADYKGDGMTDVAVYNDGTWYIEGVGVYGWGNPASIPVPGDYDGDGDADLAVYVVESGTGTWYIQGQPTVWWGGVGSIPVPGDYNGDGITDIAIYHYGTWYVKDVLTDTWGGPGDYPLPAPDYDGDGEPY